MKSNSNSGNNWKTQDPDLCPLNCVLSTRAPTPAKQGTAGKIGGGGAGGRLRKRRWVERRNRVLYRVLAELTGLARCQKFADCARRVLASASSGLVPKGSSGLPGGGRASLSFHFLRPPNLTPGDRTTVPTTQRGSRKKGSWGPKRETRRTRKPSLPAEVREAHR